MKNGTPQPVSTSGLSEVEAQGRLNSEGYNELPRPDRRTPFRIVLEVLREPMLALLLGGGVIYLALGDLREALILLAFAMVSIVITVVQETRTERVLEALRDLTSPRASFAMASARGLPGATSHAAISSSFRKAIGFPPTRCSCKRSICRPMNRS